MAEQQKNIRISIISLILMGFSVIGYADEIIYSAEGQPVATITDDGGQRSIIDINRGTYEGTIENQ